MPKSAHASPELAVKEIGDLYIRKNFQNLKDYFGDQNQLLDFNFLEVVFDEAEDNRRVAHGLSQAPKDLIRSSLIGDSSITFNRSLFDSKSLDISSSGPARVRFFVGTYFNDPSQSNLGDSDTEVWSNQASSSLSSSSVSAVKVVDRSYPIADFDEVIFVSSTQSTVLTITLPDAATNTGRILEIKKVDNTFTQHIVQTIKSQIFDSTASKTTFKLSTFNERIKIISDGSGWQILDHTYPEGDIAFTLVVTSNSGGLIEGTGVVKSAFYSRIGNKIKVIYSYIHTGAGTAGTGDYNFALPTGLSFDTAIQNVSSNPFYVVGYGHTSNQVAAKASISFAATVFAYSSTTVGIFKPTVTTNNLQDSITVTSGANTPNYGNPTCAINFTYIAPISGWEG